MAKGLILPAEEPAVAAVREFEEETGYRPKGPLLSLGEIRQKAGKRVIGFAYESDWDPSHLRSNTFEREWPPRSGVMRSFPEVDRARWFGISEVRSFMLESQHPLIDRLEALVNSPHRLGDDRGDSL